MTTRRLTVTGWTLTTVSGTDAGGGEFTVAIPEGFSGITGLLAEGDVINVAEGMIIYQPDYLVDISSVASCFESYADTPYISLLNKLAGASPTRAIHLGNLASQFLDEAVHGEDLSYAESVGRFFHRNALDMAAAEGMGATFHRDAMAQRGNIRMAVRVTLPRFVEGYDASQALIEPSFFCERLGLQGRMDYLQEDYSVLIEQKSGKGGFPQREPDTPVWLEKHYVQMLLYEAMLRVAGGTAGGVRHSFLLYSGYRNGLVRLSYSRSLVRRALMLRNQIAFLELSYARGGAEVLLTLSAGHLRRKPMSDRFWHTWVKPGLERVLSPIQGASPLEQAYFLRMVRFVAREHVLSKMVRLNEKEERTGFAAKWHTPLEEKLAAGSIIHGLRVSGLVREEGVITKVRLTPRVEGGARPHDFRVGDIVTLYAYKEGEEPDIRRGMVHRGAIEDMGITVRLRSPQSVFNLQPCLWAIEHDFHESSTTALYRSLHRFLAAPQRRKDLIMGRRQPERDASLGLLGCYGDFDDLVLGAVRALDVFLVVGPPGTGKTSFAMLNILREQLLRGGSILLSAYTNRAVDEICSRLAEEGLDYVRMGSPLSCEACYREHLLEERGRHAANVAEMRQMVGAARIFVGTTTAITSAGASLFALKSFELAIIDEASQILEPQLLGLLAARRGGDDDGGDDVAIRKFVLIGDHKQLPAVVQQPEEESRVTEPMLRQMGLTDCRHSLFERWHNSFAGQEGIVAFLSRQGRMHHDVADFPNRAFYGGRLRVAGLPHQLEQSPSPRLRFMAVENAEQPLSDKTNMAEARVIAAEVMKAVREAGNSFDPLTTVGVIVPYRSQIAAVRQALQQLLLQQQAETTHEPPGRKAPPTQSLDPSALTIDTVERYQGSQRDVIIYGFTAHHPSQLKFLTSATFTDPLTGALIDRRLNVALTRARKREVIVGNPAILSQAPVFRTLIDYCKAHGCYEVV